MGKKVWRFKYRDRVKVTYEFDDTIGKEVEQRTAENHPGWNAPIVYAADGVTCYIYSDKKIKGLALKGLELVGRNKALGD